MHRHSSSHFVQTLPPYKLQCCLVFQTSTKLLFFFTFPTISCSFILNLNWCLKFLAWLFFSVTLTLLLLTDGIKYYFEKQYWSGGHMSVQFCKKGISLSPLESIFIQYALVLKARLGLKRIIKEMNKNSYKNISPEQ